MILSILVAAALSIALFPHGGRQQETQSAAANTAPSISYDATSCVSLRARPKVCAEVLDDKGIGQVRAVFRAAGTKPYYWTVMSFDGARYCAWLPAPVDETKAIEYYVEAFDNEYEMSRSRNETIQVREDCPLPEDRPKTAAGVRPAGPNQPAAPAGFDPTTFSPTN